MKLSSNSFILRYLKGASAVAGALLFLALMLSAPAALAQGTLALRWQTCAPDGPAVMEPACSSNLGQVQLALSFRPDTAVASVIGWNMVLDIATDADPLPPWWQLQPGGCRQNQLFTVTPSGAEGQCLDRWSQTGASLVQLVSYPRLGGDTRQVRLVLAVAVPTADAFDLSAGQSYLAALLAVRLGLTQGTGACAGCTSPACIVFNSLEVIRLPKGSAPPLVLSSPEGIRGNQATWGAATACTSVPTRSRTWGQIKALYR
ncbi:MAG: hypothetical protein ABIU54_10385 [Candidatus Eisenbacteria bacterium]